MTKDNKPTVGDREWSLVNEYELEGKAKLIAPYTAGLEAQLTQALGEAALAQEQRDQLRDALSDLVDSLSVENTMSPTGYAYRVRSIQPIEAARKLLAGGIDDETANSN